MSDQPPSPPLPVELRRELNMARTGLGYALGDYVPGMRQGMNEDLMLAAIERYVRAEVRVALWQHEAQHHAEPGEADESPVRH